MSMYNLRHYITAICIVYNFANVCKKIHKIKVCFLISTRKYFDNEDTNYGALLPNTKIVNAMVQIRANNTLK